jgi:hypothetical protein
MIKTNYYLVQTNDKDDEVMASPLEHVETDGVYMVFKVPHDLSKFGHNSNRDATTALRDAMIANNDNKDVS